MTHKHPEHRARVLGEQRCQDRPPPRPRQLSPQPLTSAGCLYLSSSSLRSAYSACRGDTPSPCPGGSSGDHPPLSRSLGTPRLASPVLLQVHKHMRRRALWDQGIPVLEARRVPLLLGLLWKPGGDLLSVPGLRWDMLAWSCRGVIAGGSGECLSPCRVAQGPDMENDRDQTSLTLL